MDKQKITSKGTELPLLNLKGKPYLQVAHRLVWFREDNPKGKIETEIVKLEADFAIVKASIFFTTQDSYILVATAHKTESEQHFGDFLEKAETGAIGRALAIAGYGTQFDPELDEGNRLADSPIQVAKNKTKELLEGEVDIQVPKSSAIKDFEAATTSTNAELITKLGRVIVAKRLKSVSELQDIMEKDFGTRDKIKLKPEQAEAFIQKLRGLLA